MLPIQKSKIAKDNKARSQRMEREVAQLTKGKRVPMSGGGQIKGDVIAPLDEFRTIFIECKLSAKQDKKLGAVLQVRYEWLQKMREDARAMHCVFAMLAIKYHGFGEIWCFIPEVESRYLFDLFGRPAWAEVPIIGDSEYKGVARSFPRDYVLKHAPCRVSMNSNRFTCGVFYLVRLSDLTGLMFDTPQ